MLLLLLLTCNDVTTGNEDAVTVQSGTFSWDRNDKPALEKCVCVCARVRARACQCDVSSTSVSRSLCYCSYSQYQSEHQTWSVGGSSGSCGSWQVVTHISSPWRNGEDYWTCHSQSNYHSSTGFSTLAVYEMHSVNAYTCVFLQAIYLVHTTMVLDTHTTVVHVTDNRDCSMSYFTSRIAK